jgi:hypothetical protein
MLATKTLLGAGWTVSSRLAGRLIDFVTVLVLARDAGRIWINCARYDTYSYSRYGA